MKTDLLPCPFCGSEDLQSETGPGIQNGPTRIYCNHCDAGAPISSWQCRKTKTSTVGFCGEPYVHDCGRPDCPLSDSFMEVKQ